MSIDIQLAHACPHRTSEEKTTLDQDRTTLQSSQPISSSSTIILYANDIVIPRGGLYSSAKLKARIAGPFYIPNYETELIISTNSDLIQIDLPVSSFNNRLTTDKLIQLIREQATNLVVENENGYLVITEITTLGVNSLIQVLGKAKDHIGFDRQNMARGKMIYPSWDLYTPSNLINEVEDRLLYRGVKFNSPIKSSPYFRMSYYTFGWNCLRCKTSGIENDYRFSKTGQMLVIENENLLYQSAVKMLLTDRGSNPFFKGYGTSLRERIGSKAIGLVSQSISQEVRTSLARFQEMQATQSKYQKTSLKERLYSVLSVEVISPENDPTTFLIDVVLQNASSEPIQLSVVFTVPSTVGRLLENGIPLSQIGTF